LQRFDLTKTDMVSRGADRFLLPTQPQFCPLGYASLVLGTSPPELEALLERRQRTGADRFDEVWDGV